MRWLIWNLVILTLICGGLILLKGEGLAKEKKLTMEEKINLILDKQDQILTKLDQIKQELIRIKIRISRAL